MNEIAKEVIQHFIDKNGAKVTLTMEIYVDYEKGFDKKIIRDVSENCRILRFDNFKFEKSE